MIPIPRFVRNTQFAQHDAKPMAMLAAAAIMVAYGSAGAQSVTPPVTVTAPNTSAAEANEAASPPAVSSPDYSGDLTGDWFGLRPKLQEAGVTFGGTMITDGSWNLSGGLATRSQAWRTLVNLDVSLDTQKLFGLPGGTIYADYAGFWGQSGNSTQVGALQDFDYIDAVPFSTLYELYYDQKFGDLLQIRAGRQDAADVFAEPPDAADFINNSPTAFPPINGLLLYPISAPGIVAVVDPNGPLTFKFGAYYFDRFHSSAFDQALNTLEPTSLPVGTSLIGELDYSWQLGKNRPGVVAAGGTWRTGHLPTPDGAVHSGGAALYSYWDQTLWAGRGGENIAAFITLGGGSSQVANSASVDLWSSAGLAANGLIPARPQDQLGLGYNWVHISSQANLPKPDELNFEGFYAFNCGHGVTLQPDLQYYVNTGGGVYPDALVATIRLSLAF